MRINIILTILSDYTNSIKTVKYLIFEYQFEGHYLEYIRHILTYVQKERPSDQLYIVVPGIYKDYLNEFPTSDNFIFDFLPNKLVKKLNKRGKASIITSSFLRCKTIAEYIKKHNINKTILLNSINYIFGMSLCLPRNSTISAIEYIIPRHRPINISLAKKIEDNFRIWLYTHTKQLKTLYLLNDEESAFSYNTQFKTSKFQFLPDPIDCLIEQSCPHNEDPHKIILLHAGRFRKEKGTFDIIAALNKLTDHQRDKLKFILCGGSAIKEDEEKAKVEISKLRRKMDVEFIPGFISEDLLHRLYQQADYILIPYHNYFQSSGNLGHAASYGKPVIGPGYGLLGSLIKKYHLGYTIDELNSDGIVNILQTILANGDSDNWNFKEYVKRCSPTEFARVLLD